MPEASVAITSTLVDGFVIHPVGPGATVEVAVSVGAVTSTAGSTVRATVVLVSWRAKSMTVSVTLVMSAVRVTDCPDAAVTPFENVNEHSQVCASPQK
jgi:hypothetical protein